MKSLRIIFSIVLAVLIVFGGIAANAQQANRPGSIRMESDEARFADMAKISINSAINAASKQFPGKVLTAELENENGYLVYGVKIAMPDRQIMDVKVDAGNGKILKADKDREDSEDREREDFDNGHEDED
jgi:uncharacterized membrane protein YkoI